MKVLVPRPRAQAEPFAAALRDAGFEPIVQEVTRIVPADPGPLDAALGRVWRWVVFTSANAVTAIVARGRPRGRIAAVGERTAAALAAAGLAVDLVPEGKTAAGLARGTVNAQRALTSGRLKLRGEVDRLSAASGALAGLGDLLSGLRADTEF